MFMRTILKWFSSKIATQLVSIISQLLHCQTVGFAWRNLILIISLVMWDVVDSVPPCVVQYITGIHVYIHITTESAMDSQNQQFINTLEVSILENAIWPPAVSSCPLDFKCIYRKIQHFNTSIPANSLFCDTVWKQTWQSNFQFLFDIMNWNGYLQCLKSCASEVCVCGYGVSSSLPSPHMLWTFQGPFQWILWTSLLHEPITYLNLIHRACSQLQVQ